MDYTACAIRFHLIGRVPVSAVCAALALTRAGLDQPAAIGQLVSLTFWLLLVWWGVGIPLIRPTPRLWTAPPPGQARHAARYVFSGAMALLTACGTLTAAHFTYSGILGKSHPGLDALAACGAILWGQAVGCRALQVPSRTKGHLWLGAAVLLALAVISVIGMTA